MGYRLNRLDEPLFTAVSKPLLTEFGIHHTLESFDGLTNSKNIHWQNNPHFTALASVSWWVLATKKYSCGFKIQRQLQTRKLRKLLTMIAVICSCQDVTITTICQQSHKAILKVTKVRRSTYNLAPIKDILQKKSGFWWWPLRWQFWPLPAKRMSGALSGTLEKLCSAQVWGRILKMPKSSTTMPMCWGMLLPKQSIFGECIFYLIGYHRIW